MEVLICPAPAATDCRLTDTSSAVDDSDCACNDDYSADLFIWADTEDISADADDRPTVLAPIAPVESLRRTRARLWAEAIWPTSSLVSRSTCRSGAGPRMIEGDIAARDPGLEG